MVQTATARPPLPAERLALTDTVSWRKAVGTMWRVMQIGLETPWQVTIALLSTLLAAIFQLMIPQLLGRAVDLTQGVATGDRAAQDALLLTALAVLGVAILRGVFATFQNYFSEAVGHHTGYRLRLSYYDRIQHLSFGFHDSVHSGDLITLGLLDIEGARMFFATGIIRFLLLFVLIGFGGWWLLSIDLWLGLLALSFVPYVGWRSSQSQLELRQTWLDLQERLSVLSRVMEENLAGTRIVRAFSAQDHEMQKFREASVRALDLAHERVDLRVNSTAAMTLSFLLAMGAVLLVGGIKVRTGEMTVGTLTAFLTFMTILQMPVRQLGMLVNSIARTSTCGARVFGLLDLEPSVADVPGARDLRIDGPVLRFEDVGFAYPSARDTPVLRNLSFTAGRGEIIGIIGPPGSGKTTVAQLIPRFYDVTSGAITIDGQDLRDVTLASLRRSVKVVSQDVFMFTTTMENNIAYGDPWAEEDAIEGSSGDAQLHAYVDTLPERYRTVVGERGASLSGGQRQRMSIARTLLVAPEILVFDDSTAAIDARTERRILAAIRAGRDRRITILVAHRLSTLADADRILVLEQGRIVEQGNHAELMALGGRYRSLHDLQNRSYGDRR
ncbi:ABC transporter ATP-binding protein [uncultured Roseicyclus sp.]|uniref:ABC transporter ATP-binding protein n=1 Tax=uncultured Roseicyclus sp. TaxID=543072 RepID=UPI00263816B2|nr:ABC transporter ATP-binding protein [uncultured Roseicyclus sp.]